MHALVFPGNAACSTALATNRMQQPQNAGPNLSPIPPTNGGSSNVTTKAQVTMADAQGSILPNSVSAENSLDNLSSSNFGQSSTQK
jgi:hypothetical protein